MLDGVMLEDTQVQELMSMMTNLVHDTRKSVGVAYIENGVRLQFRRSEALRRYIHWADWELHDDEVQRVEYDLDSSGEFIQSQSRMYEVACDEHTLRKLVTALRELR